jgi:hypothetical protein
MTPSPSSDWKPSPRQILAQANAESRRYDQIGFHVRSLSQRAGFQPLTTLAEIEDRLAKTEDTSHDVVMSGAFLRLKERIAHRAIDMPTEGRFRYEIVGTTLLRMTLIDERTGDEQEWMYSLMRPPFGIAAQAEERDVPPLIAQRVEVDLPGMRWLPLTTLIKTGRFHRMQDWSDQLGAKTEPGRFYTFVSHRWLTATHPDPDGLQGGLIAWQMLAHLCEAVFVAQLRGLHTPRRFSPSINVPIGIAGSELAESLLVNVLRYHTDERSLPQLFEEARSIEQLVEDRGLEEAARDPRLDRIRNLIADRPLLTECASRINIWYDYSCMPQEPRTPAEQRQFEDGFTRLNDVQFLGHTAVLLDEVSEYLCRGWCVLESVFADSVVPSPLQILNGGAVARADRERTESHFRDVLRDRPHLIWRAILDTEVFRIQSPTECMERLALDTTRPEDLSFVYEALRKLHAPRAVHIDDSELVTGCFPLPVTADGNSVVLTCVGGRDIAQTPSRTETATLDWSECLDLETAWLNHGIDKSFVLPSVILLAEATAQDNRLRSPCHVAVIASCEGEAAVISAWVLKRIGDLEAIVGRRIQTMSWLASDIAPVGHFKEENLTFAAIDADVWVLVTFSARLLYCSTTALLQRSLQFANKTCFEFALDVSSNNLAKVARSDSGAGVSGGNFVLLGLRDFQPRRLPGGVFRDDLLTAIAKNAEPVQSVPT